MLIVSFGIIFLTGLVILGFTLVIRITINRQLKDTVQVVKKTFTETIERVEPGTFGDQSSLNLVG